jgi:small-conductance mechanosensitive channel
MPGDIKDFLDHRLISIGGAAVTVGSLLFGAAVVLVALVLANLFGFWTQRLLRARGAEQGAQFAIAKIVRYAVITIGLIAGFDTMGVRFDALIAASAVVAVGIGFGLQNIAQNFISGLILLIERPVRHGDFVRVGETLGTVEDIGLRATHIVSRDQVTIIVPNSALVGAEVINHSRPTTNLRIRIAVGVGYGTDTDHVKSVLLDVAKNDARVLNEPPPEVRLEDFGESALNFALLCWIEHAREDLRIASSLRFAIESAFRREGIEIPCPRRDLRLRT